MTKHSKTVLGVMIPISVLLLGSGPLERGRDRPGMRIQRDIEEVRSQLETGPTVDDTVGVVSQGGGAASRTPCDIDADCDDGLFCNGAETCVTGECQLGVDPCYDGEICDEDADVCIFVGCLTDADCAPGETCVEQWCSITCVSDDPDCDDADACTTDACVAGTCAWEEVLCDTGQTCNVLTGVCESTVCVGDADCDDGVFCNGWEECFAGECQSGVLPCASGEICDEDQAVCIIPTVCVTDADCDDADACTTDGCAAGTCSSQVIDCDDADACTDDACVAGICTNEEVLCDAGQTCNVLTGVCESIVCVGDADCDDEDACTIDACVAGTCAWEEVLCDSGQTCNVLTGVCETTGACCFSGGCHNYYDPTECTKYGGTPQGPDSTCESISCPNQACCIPDLTCSDLPPDDCYWVGGRPRGLDTTCTSEVCPAFEACCLAWGCQDEPPDNCARFSSGVPQGPGSTCDSISCPSQACCMPDLTCSDLPPEDCPWDAWNGGSGSTCASITCPAFEACCTEWGCTDRPPEVCTNNYGGVPQGPGSVCGSTSCMATEACCFPDESCADESPAVCVELEGLPQGPGSGCDTVICENVCCDPVIHVDDDAPDDGDGLSWETAYRHLQDALVVASPGDEIWVAQGTYVPSDCDGGECLEIHRQASFQLISGVALYGGFAGSEPTLEERAGLFDQTILTGDLNSDDGLQLMAEFVACFSGTDVTLEPGCEVFDYDGDNDVDLDDRDPFLVNSNYGENSYQVVKSSGTDDTVILDGFTISGGSAVGAEFPPENVSGMHNDQSSPRVTNCTFIGNIGSGMKNTRNSSPAVSNCTFTQNIGSGMSNNQSNASVTNCTFTQNFASGMGNGRSSPSVTNCVFTGNFDDFSGGGMNNVDSSPMVIHCTFSGNTATRSGGGMSNSNGSNPTVTHCTFGQNTASSGGGMNNSNSNPTVIHCTFRGNIGGGMRNGSNSSPTVTHCTFSENAGFDAGGMLNANNSATVTHCTFSENTATNKGGGMTNVDSNSTVTNCIFSGNIGGSGGGMVNEGGSPTVNNCTFSGNSANRGGGGMFNWINSTPTINNCIFSGNAAYSDGGGIRNANGSSSTVTNCTFSGNSANRGGGMSNDESSNLTVTNSIFWQNSDAGGMDESAQVHDDGVSASTVIYSTVQGGWTGAGGIGNIDADPLFIDADGPDDIPGTEDDDLRLSPDSPCIDTGAPGVMFVPGETDLDGHARVLCGRVDMGAYEFGIGDDECDEDVDLFDFANWTACMTGPENGPFAEGCEAFDFDGDNDVDLEDFGGFQQVFIGD